MDTLNQSNTKVPQNCKICGMASHLLGEAKVLRKYRVQYYRCVKCGFTQTEALYWLEEAYSSAIACQNVGIMRRNLANCKVTSAVLNLLFQKTSNVVDFGAGHGVFVRLMRDRGFNFFWPDLRATNDYARGFESQEGATYDFPHSVRSTRTFDRPGRRLLAANELVRERAHFDLLVSSPTPALSDWWYHVPTTGQHIVFYTPE